MDVTINDKTINAPNELATWGELLDWIETGYLTAGQCITHVYLGGAETCNYRDRLVCDRGLELIGPVEVSTGDFDQVVYESLAELCRELDTTVAGSAEIIRLFENRNEVEAYNRLGQLLECIRIFFTIFSEDLGWAEPDEPEMPRAEFSTALERALTQLISAQEKRHWVAICDVLEYEITPLLESWQKMVMRTREHIHS